MAILLLPPIVSTPLVVSVMSASQAPSDRFRPDVYGIEITEMGYYCDEHPEYDPGEQEG